MKIDVHNIDNKLTIKLIGRLDTMNAADIESQINPILDHDNLNVIFDCEEFEYISSSGLRLFLTLQKKINKRDGTLIMINLLPEIQEVFDMTGFSKIFDIE